MKTRSVQSRALLCTSWLPWRQTSQKKVTCLQQVSLYSTGSYLDQIRVWPGLLSGSDPDCYPGQLVIWVSGTDPVSTLTSKVPHNIIPAHNVVETVENKCATIFFCVSLTQMHKSNSAVLQPRYPWDEGRQLQLLQLGVLPIHPSHWHHICYLLAFSLEHPSVLLHRLLYWRSV